MEQGHRDPSGIFWAKSEEIQVRNFSNNGIKSFFKTPISLQPNFMDI